MNRRLLTAVSLFVLAVCLCACGGGDKKAGGLSCGLSVLTHTEALIEDASVDFAEGDTVMDILTAAVQDARLQIETSGTGATAYVRGINDLYEFDEGPESGWTYTVNGEEIMQSAGAYEPQDGDAIVWQYITEQ